MQKLLDLHHPLLVRLAQVIDWNALGTTFGPPYDGVGESDGVSHQCAASAQGAAGVGAGGQTGRVRHPPCRIVLGRVIRNVERQCPTPPEPLALLLAHAKRIQTQAWQTSPKLYSVHALEVACIADGTVPKKSQFDCKVAVTTTSNWIVGIQAQHANPCDGAMLNPALEQVKRLTAVPPEHVLVDPGYRGTQYHPAGVTV